MSKRSVTMLWKNISDMLDSFIIEMNFIFVDFIDV